MIMRIHQDLFPDGWERDGFDKARFFGGLSLFAGLALIIVTGVS
jgi:hypothetical protein